MEEVPTPKPGRGEVLIETRYCGICGSDLHLVEKGLLPGGAIIGHEASGVVAELGEGVDGFKVGEAVTIMPIDPCGRCEPCRAGDTHRCVEGAKRNYGLGVRPGFFAQYLNATPAMLHRVPAGLDLKVAALCEPYAVALHGVNWLGELGDRPVAILGAGPIGLLCYFALRARGVRRVLVSEPDPFRAGLAAQAGADPVVDPTKIKLGSACSDFFHASPEVVIDCAGAPKSLAEAVAAVTPGGRALLLGIHMGSLSFQPMVWFFKEVCVKCSLGYQAREFGDALSGLGRGEVEARAVISDVLPLAEIGEAFRLLSASGRQKVLIDCREA